jgi:hypothetical protein
MFKTLVCEMDDVNVCLQDSLKDKIKHEYVRLNHQHLNQEIIS